VPILQRLCSSAYVALQICLMIMIMTNALCTHENKLGSEVKNNALGELLRGKEG